MIIILNLCLNIDRFITISIDNRYIPIFNRVATSLEDILRYHKISFDTLNTLVTRKYRFSKKIFVCESHDQKIKYAN